MTFEHELKIITRAVEEIIPLDELIAKLALSAKEGRPLRIKYKIVESCLFERYNWITF